MDNSENFTWNEVHQGSRVPINNSGIDGAPTSLHGNIPEWFEGSVNKAVRDTFLMQPSIRSLAPPTLLNGVADLRALKDLVIRDMLYGVSGDARNNTPGDMMSFRGYPTPVILPSTFTNHSYAAPKELGLGGNPGSNEGEWAIFELNMSLKYPLPYDVIMTLNHTFGGDVILYDVLFAKGQKTITAGKLQVNPQWEYTMTGKLYISVNTSKFSTNVTQSLTTVSVKQSPYYGPSINLTEPVLISNFRPGVPQSGYSIGFGVLGPRIPNVNCFVSTCNKLPQSSLFQTSSTLTELYLQRTSTLQVGSVLYLDKGCVTKAPIGVYVLAEFLYKATYEDVFFVHTYITVDNNGNITRILKNINSGEDTCWLTSPCG